jgi:hypothetical protein
LQAQYQLASAIALRADEAYADGERVRSRDAALARALTRANGGFARLLLAVESGDGAPTATQVNAFRTQAAALEELQRQAHRP